jgi:hypothetical protein
MRSLQILFFFFLADTLAAFQSTSYCRAVASGLLFEVDWYSSDSLAKFPCIFYVCLQPLSINHVTPDRPAPQATSTEIAI